jgi:hypothetical protein
MVVAKQPGVRDLEEEPKKMKQNKERTEACPTS